MQEKLLVLRKRNKYSQTFLAEYLELSATQYRAKENGDYEFTADEMFKASKLFNLKIEDIFTPRSHRFGDVEE